MRGQMNCWLTEAAIYVIERALILRISEDLRGRALLDDVAWLVLSCQEEGRVVGERDVLPRVGDGVAGGERAAPLLPDVVLPVAAGRAATMVWKVTAAGAGRASVMSRVPISSGVPSAAVAVNSIRWVRPSLT